MNVTNKKFKKFKNEVTIESYFGLLLEVLSIFEVLEFRVA